MKKITSIILLIISSAQGGQIDIQKKAINDAKVSSLEASIDYLNCYALEENEKSLCNASLSQKYVNSDWHSNEFYIREFRFQMEKLGFYNLLLKNGLECDNIADLPFFIEQENAYLLKCGSRQNYLVKFDYQNKNWIILK